MRRPLRLDALKLVLPILRPLSVYRVVGNYGDEAISIANAGRGETHDAVREVGPLERRLQDDRREQRSLSGGVVSGYEACHLGLGGRYTASRLLGGSQWRGNACERGNDEHSDHLGS